MSLSQCFESQILAAENTRPNGRMITEIAEGKKIYQSYEQGFLQNILAQTGLKFVLFMEMSNDASWILRMIMKSASDRVE